MLFGNQPFLRLFKVVDKGKGKSASVAERRAKPLLHAAIRSDKAYAHKGLLRIAEQADNFLDHRVCDTRLIQNKTDMGRFGRQKERVTVLFELCQNQIGVLIHAV